MLNHNMDEYNSKKSKTIFLIILISVFFTLIFCGAVFLSYLLFNVQNWLNQGGVSPNDVPKAARSQQYMVAGNGWRHHDNEFQVQDHREFAVISIKYISDEYWTYDPVFLFSNFYLTTGRGGKGEADGTDPFTIRALSVKVGGDVPIAYQAGHTLAGGESWLGIPPGDQRIAIPPRSSVLISYSIGFTKGGLRVGLAQGIRPSFGDRAEYDSSNLDSKVMHPETITSSLPTGNEVYPTGIVGAFAKGWDGRAVVLGLGTSISNGAGTVRTTSGPFGERGHLDLGMTSQVNGALRLPHLNWSRNGAYAGGIDRMGAGLSKRKQALDLLPNIPFTTVVSELGTNDQTPDRAAWRDAIYQMHQGIKLLFPNCKLVQVTFVPRTVTKDGFQTTENQSPSENWDAWPSSAAATVEAWLLNQESPADLVLDWRKYWDGRDEGGTVGKFRADRKEGFSAKLMKDVSKGDMTIYLDAVPRIGTPLAIDTNRRIEMRTVFKVSGYNAPYAVDVSAFTGSASLAYDHPAGAPVAEAIVEDGVHPPRSLTEYVASSFWSQAKGLF